MVHGIVYPVEPTHTQLTFTDPYKEHSMIQQIDIVIGKMPAAFGDGIAPLAK